MTNAEVRNLLALIWGQHGAQSAAARHFGVADRTVRRWASGDVSVPGDVANELRRLADRAPMPVIPPPRGNATDDAAAEAIRPAYVALMLAAERAGWHPAEAAKALLSWLVADMRKMAGDEATRKTLTAALMMLDE